MFQAGLKSGQDRTRQRRQALRLGLYQKKQRKDPSAFLGREVAS